MKKDQSRKLNFNSISVTELNLKHLAKVVGGAPVIPPSNADDYTSDTFSDSGAHTCKTQSGPRDGYSKDCNQ